MKIYIILGHPAGESFNSKIADACEQMALTKGNLVRRHNLADLDFDPILRNGYKVVQELEPDLVQAKENIIWCDQILIIYPMWWGSMPALLKGFIDRVFLPGFAFRYREDGIFWDRLLKGKSAQIICTSDAPWWWIWWKYSNSDLHTIRDALLEFCGIKPVRFRRIGMMKTLTEKQRSKILDKLLLKLF